MFSLLRRLCMGWNLFSSRMHETEEDRAQNHVLLAGYTEVEPVMCYDMGD